MTLQLSCELVGLLGGRRLDLLGAEVPLECAQTVLDGVQMAVQVQLLVDRVATGEAVLVELERLLVDLPLLIGGEVDEMACGALELRLSSHGDAFHWGSGYNMKVLHSHTN